MLSHLPNRSTWFWYKTDMVYVLSTKRGVHNVHMYIHMYTKVYIDVHTYMYFLQKIGIHTYVYSYAHKYTHVGAYRCTFVHTCRLRNLYQL